MPILDRILSTPASTAAWNRPCASGLVRSPSSARSASAATVASARRGQVAAGAQPGGGGERALRALGGCLVDGAAGDERRDRGPVRPGLVDVEDQRAGAALDGGHGL